MMHGRMESLEVLVRQVMPLVLPCPRSMVLDALMMAAKEFCEQAAVWRVRLESVVGKGESEIVLQMPREARLHLVLGVWLEDRKLHEDEYRVEGDIICLRETMPRDVAAFVDASLRPARTADHLPESIIDAWGDVLAYGAQARLKAMTGHKVEWSDGAGAQIALEQFNLGVARARIRAMSKW